MSNSCCEKLEKLRKRLAEMEEECNSYASVAPFIIAKWFSELQELCK